LAGQQRTGLFFLQLALVSGAIPAEEALRLLDRLLPEVPDAFSLVNRAWLLAMLDRFDEAVPLARESNARLRDLDGRRLGEWRLTEIAILAGDHETATAHCGSCAHGSRSKAFLVISQDALERYERKQNLPMARQVRERLAALQASARPI
jgi:hypothetical protein